MVPISEPSEHRLKELVEQMRQGKRIALARLMSIIENRGVDIPTLMKLIYPHTGNAQIWGITGPPGAGKSTLVDALCMHLRKDGKRVAIIAIDPSSPFSGGAVLGDRIRMQRHSGDKNVFIRSAGTRGKHGGLSPFAKELVLLLDAAQFDVILVETAGVGQTELGILRLAQSVAVILVPESGDSIQVMKAGLMEIADVFIVNKADRPEADRLVRELVNNIALANLGPKDWNIPVLKAEAVRDIGVQEIIDSIKKHQVFLSESGLRKERAKDFFSNEIQDILTDELTDKVLNVLESKKGEAILSKLINRKTDPYAAAGEISKLIS